MPCECLLGHSGFALHAGGGRERQRIAGAFLCLIAKMLRYHRLQTVFNVQGFVGTNMVFHADVIGISMTRKEEP